MAHDAVRFFNPRVRLVLLLFLLGVSYAAAAARSRLELSISHARNVKTEWRRRCYCNASLLVLHYYDEHDHTCCGYGFGCALVTASHDFGGLFFSSNFQSPPLGFHYCDVTTAAYRRGRKKDAILTKYSNNLSCLYIYSRKTEPFKVILVFWRIITIQDNHMIREMPCFMGFCCFFYNLLKAVPFLSININ